MTKVSLWIINHYGQEPGRPGGSRHHDLAKALTVLGWDVTIIASSLEHNTDTQRLGEQEEYRVETYSGVRFLWLRGNSYQGNGFGRAWNLLTFSLKAASDLDGCQIPRPSIIIGSSVHPFAALAALRQANRYSIPFVFEIRDLWPQTLIDMGKISEHGVPAMVMRLIERTLVLKAAFTISVLPHIAAYFTEKRLPVQAIRWLPNGVSIESMPKDTRDVLSDTFTFMYFGAHGEANGLHIILHAVSLLRKLAPDRKFQFRLVGDGPRKESLRSLARELLIDDVVLFEDPVPKREIPALASEADAFIFNLIGAGVFRYGISSNKLFDYLMVGRPVIFACEAGNNPVSEAAAGITVPPENPQAMAHAMLRLMDSTSQEREIMGRNGRAYVERNHDIKRIAAILHENLMTAINSHSQASDRY